LPESSNSTYRPHRPIVRKIRYMDTQFLTPLCLLFILCTSDQQTNINFVVDPQINIPTNFGYNWPNGLKCKFTDYDDDDDNNGHQVMAIPMTLWIR
jgi:hypothetical protein